MTNIRKKFMRTAELISYAAGNYVDGVWQDGTATHTQIQAAIQPLTAGDYRLLPEGNSSSRGWKVWWNGNFQLGNDGEIKPDEMIIDGINLKLVHKEEWQANGYSAGSFIEIKS